MKTNSKKLCSLLLACAMMVTTVVSASAAKVSGMADNATEIVVTADSPQTFYVDGVQITASVLPADGVRPRISESATASRYKAFAREYTCVPGDGNYGCVSVENDTRDNEKLDINLQYRPGNSSPITIVSEITPREKLYIEAKTVDGSGLTGSFSAFAVPVNLKVTLPLYYSCYQQWR